ncbi:MAG TPA: restriction endonuclease subunit S [Bacteroidales bacterium]|nr:restriction endonuclease subunit S [Bacteroidales bacterium]HRX98177.1 restriction endonuclease subunit S [Bacteroidales bacterium]
MKEDWVDIKIGDIFKTITGTTPSKKNPDNYGNEVPLVKPPQLNNSVISESSEYLSQEGASLARILPVNSVLITCIGNLGRVGINKIPIGFNQQINAILPLKQVNSKFTFYQAQNPYFKEQLNYLGSATTVSIVNKGKFDTIVYRLPPLPIQRAIVQKIETLFTSLDKGIADLKQAQQQLKIYRQAVLKKAFEGAFVPECSSWHKVKIRSLCEVVRGGSPRPAGDPKYYGGGIPFLKVADLTRNEGAFLNSHTYTIKEAGLRKTRIVEPNTLLLSNSGATLGIPKICTFETTFNDGIAAFLGIEPESLLYHYYFWLSKTKELRNINQGAAQPNLNTSLIGDTEIIIGNLADQKQTVKEIETRLSVCDQVEQSISEALEQSEALRQSILKKAFDGELLSEEEIEACKREKDYEPAGELLKRIQKEKKIN